MMSTPLIAEGDAIGAITVFTTEQRRFTPREIDLLESISHHAAFIVRNASLYTKECSIAESLQRSLMSDTPEECHGLSFAGRYIPVADEARVGGDFYEVTPLPNGKVGVVIADVSGKGLTAAMHLAASKFTMKAYMFAHPEDPASVLAELNDAINYYFDLSFFVTMFYCVIDTEAETLTYANAGHLPALLISGKGRLHAELGSTGTPVGAGQPCRYENGTADFGPGDKLLLYTDGVTDATKRGESLDIEGLHRLVFESEASSAPGLVDYICKHLEHEGESARKDDIALLAVSFDRIRVANNALLGGSNGQEIQLPNPAI
jgi:serine phosphatase RsbU (regulator of sigma subunit)